MEVFMGWYSGYKKDALSSNIFRYSENNVKDGKKQKEVYSTLTSLCHAWASENVLRGRSGCSMFFERGVIYSYGYHYQAAKIHTNKRGEKLVLVNSKDYSHSTQNHLNEIRSATKHLKNIRVPYVSEGHGIHSSNLEYLSNLIADHTENILLMRQYSSVESVKSIYKNILEYCKFFDLKVPFKLDDFSLELLKQSEKAHAKKRIIRDQKLKENRDRRNLELKEKCKVELSKLESSFPKVLEDWKNFEINDRELINATTLRVSVPAPFGRTRSEYLKINIDSFEGEIKEEFSKRNHESIRAWRAGEISAHDIEDSLYLGSIKLDLRSKYALLRVKGNKVETSEGADVPLDHALRLLSIIERGQARKGERVGVYNLESVSDLNKEPVIVTIGCHKIELSEAKRVLSPYKQ
jgi:hypothetical protein